MSAFSIPARPTSPRCSPVTFECPTCHTSHVNRRTESLNIQHCGECGKATCSSCGAENRDQCERCGGWFCYRHIHLVGDAPREPEGLSEDTDERQALCVSCAATPVRMIDTETGRPVGGPALADELRAVYTGSGCPCADCMGLVPPARVESADIIAAEEVLHG